MEKSTELESRKDIYIHLAKNNDPKYNLLKAAEELQELALVLMQKALKPTKVHDVEITDEIGDVKIRLKILSKMFPEFTDVVEKRIDYKLGKYREYIQEGKYKDI